jgi:magnesium transporter
MSLESLLQFSEHLDKSVKSVYQDVKELIEKLLFNLKEIHENILSLIHLHVSISSHKINELSHKTNEIIRVLTIFSVFFLPLNFIAGVYGMNFEFMPELKSPLGYPIVIGAMVFVVLSLLVWFWKRGWLQ